MSGTIVAQAHSLRLHPHEKTHLPFEHSVGARRAKTTLPSTNKRRVTPCRITIINGSNGGGIPSTIVTGTTYSEVSSPLTKLVKEQEKNNARDTILEYLRSLEIDTQELEDLSLPTSLQVMEERVEFLQKLGLTTEGISEYPLMLGCSVKKNMVPVLDYLEKLGVRKSSLPELLRRYPQVLHSSIVIDLRPVVNYLSGLGITPGDLPRVLEGYPDILGFKLEGTMATSVAYLVGIGVATRAIAPMITQYPPILAMRVGKVIKPFVDYLIGLGIEKQAVARMLENKPYILGLGFKFEEKVKENLESLFEYGVRRDCLSTIVQDFPDILGFDLKSKMESQSAFFRSCLGIDSEGFGKAVQRMPQIVAISHQPVLRRIGMMRLWGFSVEEMSLMVVRCPHVLALNKNAMELAFNFFRNEIKGSLREIVEFPTYFTYDLEKRIKPRFWKVKRKGIECSLSWFLSCSDEKFEERLDSDFIGLDEMESSLGSELGMSSEDGDVSDSQDAESDDEFYKRALYRS